MKPPIAIFASSIPVTVLVLLLTVAAILTAGVVVASITGRPRVLVFAAVDAILFGVAAPMTGLAGVLVALVAALLATVVMFVEILTYRMVRATYTRRDGDTHGGERR